MQEPDTRRLRKILEQVDDLKKQLTRERMRSGHLRLRVQQLTAQRTTDAQRPMTPPPPAKPQAS
jgi:hypothetical protein